MLEAPHRAIAAAVVVIRQAPAAAAARRQARHHLSRRYRLFGGHREGDESALDCVVRELAEELTYDIAPERFLPLAHREGEDSERKGGTFRGDFFLVRDVHATRSPSPKAHCSSSRQASSRESKTGDADGALALDAYFAMCAKG